MTTPSVVSSVYLSQCWSSGGSTTVSGPPPGGNTLVVSGPTGSTTVLLSCYLQVSQWLYDHQSNQPTIVTTIPSSALQTVPNHPEHFQDELLGSAYKKMYAHCVTGAENRWGDHRARARIYVRLNRWRYERWAHTPSASTTTQTQQPGDKTLAQLSCTVLWYVCYNPFNFSIYVDKYLKSIISFYIHVITRESRKWWWWFLKNQCILRLLTKNHWNSFSTNK